MGDQHSREISIFLEAIEKDTTDELRSYLDEACGDDQRLRADVEGLLVAHNKDNSFLERPAVELDRTVNVNRDAMDDGLAPAFGAEAAVVVGGTGHSVLKSLSKRLPEVPQVTLYDSQEERGAIVQPGSSELPKSQDDSRYQLLGEIARGGMGAIIKGRDTDLGRDLAIKVLLDSHKEKPEVVQRFVEEAQIGGQLQHPGIVPVYELGQFSDQRPFFSMKLVKGQTLAAILAKRKDPSDDLPHLLGIFEQVCQTMAYAHSKGVIHRDLKPANIMVGAFGEVQVMDWGLSKVLREGGVADEQKSLDKQREVSVIRTRRSTGSETPGEVGSQTQMGSVMGTPAYMPPEQALGEVDRLEARADVFGLGAILAEILTGKAPYVADDSTQVFRMASRGKLGECHARLYASNAEPELIELAKTALSPEPHDRMADAGALSTAITGHLEGVQERIKQTELARVEAETRSKEERRRRKLHLAIAGMMLVLAVGAAVAFRLRADAETRHAREERKARQLAEAESRRAYSMRLAAQSRSIVNDLPVTSTLLAIESVESSRSAGGPVLPVTHATLLTATHNVGGRLLTAGDSRMWVVQVSPNGRWIVTVSRDSALLWDLTADDPTASRLVLERAEGQHPFPSAVISADSRWLAIGAGGSDPPVYLWDLNALELGRPTFVLKGHTGSIHCVAISSDKRWLVTGSEDATVRLWDLTAPDPSEVWRELPHNSAVSALAVDPKSQWLATANFDGTVQRFDLSSEQPTHSRALLAGVDADGLAWHSLAIDPTGRWLACGTWGKTIRLWDLTSASRTPIVLGLDGHDGNTMAFAFSQNGRWLTAGGQLWDLTSNDPASSSLVLLDCDPYSLAVAISPNNRWLIAGGRDHPVRIWDLTLDDPTVLQHELRAHQETISTVAISPDNRWLVTGSWDGTARLWDLRARNPASPFVLSNEIRLHSSPQGNWLVTGTPDGRLFQLRSFNTAGGHPLTRPKFLRGQDSPFTQVALGERWLVTGGEDEKVRVWDLHSTTTRPRVLEGIGKGIRSLAISGDDRWLVRTVDDSRTAILVDLQDTAAPPHELEGYRVYKEGGFLFSPIAVSPDGHWLATADGQSVEQHVRIWDLRSPDPASAWTELPPSIISGEASDPSLGHVPTDNRVPKLKFSPDSRWLATQHFDGSVRLWDLTNEDPEQQWLVLRGHTDLVNAIAFTPDCRRLVTVSWDGRARLWHLFADDPASSSVQLGKLGKSAALYCAVISRDGQRLVTAGEDKTARVWNLTADDPAAAPLILRGHPEMITQAAISPDGRWVFTGSNTDDTVRVWDLDVDQLLERARELVGRELTVPERDEFEIVRQ